MIITTQDDDATLYAWMKGFGIASFLIIVAWILLAFNATGAG